MEMKEVLDREGRDAKNVIMYQFIEETALQTTTGKVSPQAVRKPPMPPPKLTNSHSLRTTESSEMHSAGRLPVKQTNGPRVRSASTGRDKKSELQARYWALLFGNLQRAVNEIYQTVECYENISSCQEAILVLENYVRDFKALSEWFKVSWDYESRPLQQRQLALAWEVRKSNPLPRVRAKSLCSPTNMSGKSSPLAGYCNSGKSSPCGLADNVSPKKSLRDLLPRGTVCVNVRDLFAANKTRAADAKDLQSPVSPAAIEFNACQHKFAQTDMEDDHLTLADIREREKQREQQHIAANETATEPQICFWATESCEEITTTTTNVINSNELTTIAANNNEIEVAPPTAVEMTIAKLDAMENAVLVKDADKMPTLPTTELKKMESSVCSPASTKNTPVTAASNDLAIKKNATITPTNVSQNSPLKYSSVLNRPAANRSNIKQTTNARAHPATTAATSIIKATAITKSNPNPSAHMMMRRSATTVNNNRTISRSNVKSTPRVNVVPSNMLKSDSYNPPSNVALRLSARSRTMIEINKNTAEDAQKLTKKMASSITTSRRNSSQKSSREDVGSSNSTLKASNERMSSSRNSLVATVAERRSEPKQLPSEVNDGWLTVKNRRRSSMHWANRFNQPTGYASLPTLALRSEEEQKQQQKQMQQKKQKDKSKDEQQTVLQRKSSIITTAAVAKTNENNNLKTKVEVKDKDKHIVQKVEKSDKNLKASVIRPEIKTAKAKVNSLRTPPSSTVVAAAVKKSNDNSSESPREICALPSRQTIIKRQRSDLTGLKITSLHKEYMRSEKNAQRRSNEQQKCALPNASNGAIDYSSTETIIDGKEKLIVNGNCTDMEFGSEQAKIDIKIQTNNDFSKTIGDLYESIAKLNAEKLTTDATKSSLLPSCDENDETLVQDMDCDEDQRKLVEEQEFLEQQIRELESTEIDVDTETDETDCEVVLETEHEDEDCNTDQALEDASSSIVFVPVHEDANISLEMRYQALLSEMSWGEREQTLATLQAYVSRHPGRAQELHQKLSSPSRRRSLQETLKKYQAKQARAQQKRELLQKEKTIKIQQLLARVEDVKAAKRQLIEGKRLKMEGRLQRAAENREQYLRQIIEKAHDEEKKLKEINFIKNIEAQNKRLDLLESSKETEGRLLDLEQERQKRLEEKAAKEAAVERRRQELEKERRRKLEKMNESRLEKEQRIGKMQEQKEQQRLALAREKARDREERLLALQAQQQQSTEELQRKILQKQKESARRHEENIEHIRQRALELTIPTRNLEENGKINENDKACNESSVDDGDLSSTVSDVGSKEHSRAFKKKLKKLKQRLAASADEYLKELQPLPVHVRRESQVPKYLNLVAKGGGAQGMERALGHLLLIASKAQFEDFQCFLHLDGLGVITTHVILNGMQDDADVSKKSVVMAIQLYRNVCTLCPQIARHAIMGNTLATLFEVLLQAMQLPDEFSPQHPVELSTELMLACTVALAPAVTKKYTHPKMAERLPDLTSYAVLIGLIDLLSRRCMKVRESIENYPRVMLSLLTTIGFITRFVEICPRGNSDCTRLLNSAKCSELFGTISMLYASIVPIGECIPPRTISLAAAGFNLLVAFAALDLPTFQEILSNEPLSMKFFDVVLILLKYCDVTTTATNGKTEKAADSHAVIIDVLASIGFLCANNKKNQDLLVSDQHSIIVKSLTKLPAVFDSIVYPCLVTITLRNQNARNVLSRDFNLDFLDAYRKSDAAKKNRLIQLLQEKQNA